MSEKPMFPAMRSTQELKKDIWNEAIEAAAKLADSNNTGTASSNQIRALRK